MTPGEIAFNGYYTQRAQQGRVPRTYSYSRLSLTAKLAWENAARALILELARRTISEVMIPLDKPRHLVNGTKFNIQKRGTRGVLLEQKKK